MWARERKSILGIRIRRQEANISTRHSGASGGVGKVAKVDLASVSAAVGTGTGSSRQVIRLPTMSSCHPINAQKWHRRQSSWIDDDVVTMIDGGDIKVR